MRLRKLLILGCATVMSTHINTSVAADIVIGVPSWPSVRATAHVLKVALEENLGLDVELRDGSNPVIFDAMDAGAIHVHPEVWLPNNNHLKERFVDAKQTVRMSPNSVAGEQGMCVTKATAERTGIAKLSDLTDPAMASKFDTDGDGKGEVWIGAPTWASTTIENIRARSYGYDSTMNLKEISESEALTEVDDAVKGDKDIVFFCYSPHHIFQTYELIVLEEPAHDAKRWTIVQPSAIPGWLEKSSARTAWDTASLHISYVTSLETDRPEVAAMLAKVSLDTDTVSAMTHALVVEQQDPAEFAAAWVEENAEIVAGWLE